MSFYSVHAPKIWDYLYTAYVPELVTQNTDFLKRFGHFTTGDEELDKLRLNERTMVKIPIIKMMEYYNEGIVVEIPSRDDMITIHKHIELYLCEWKSYMTQAINKNVEQHKDLIMGLENLSKLIYAKAQPKEVIDNLFMHRRFGLVNPLQQMQEDKKEISKPDYSGISEMIRQHRRGSRYGA